jgi:hypothetical protein
MSNQSDDSVGSVDAAFTRLQEDYADDRYYECLVGACDLFLRIKDDRGGQLNGVVLEFMRQCVSHLSDEDDKVVASKHDVACSFCGKTSPEVRLGAGPSVFICNECVGVFSHVL